MAGETERESLFTGLRKLLDDATPRPWCVVGPPCNHHAPWINQGSEDPHTGRFIADLDHPTDDHANPHRFADAELICVTVNALAETLELLEAAHGYIVHFVDTEDAGIDGFDVHAWAEAVETIGADRG